MPGKRGDGLTRRDFLKASAAAAGIAAAPLAVWAKGTTPVAEGSNAVRPSATQLMWQDLELCLLVDFDMPVYLPQGWDGRVAYRQTLDPAVYNPAKLDTDQWLAAAKAMGAGYAIFTATHGNGFRQWQSENYPYGLRQTKWRDGKGDIVKDFVESCRRVGIKPGLFISCRYNAYWTAEKTLVGFGKGDDTAKQAAYIKTCEEMVEQLCSRYGEIVELWFDGGVLTPDKGGPDVLPIFEKHQPNSIFYHSRQRMDKRWAGTEDGTAGYPCWATVPSIDSLYDLWNTKPHESTVIRNGDPDGKLWCPSMCDIPLRGTNGMHAWFWRPNEEHAVYPLADLMDIYDKSEGRNANLVIGVTPDRDGLIPDVDMRRCAEFGAEIRRRFSKPVAQAHGIGDVFELALSQPAKIDHAVLMEDIAHGELVREYVIEGLIPGNSWRKLASGSSIGHKRIEQFEPVEVAKVRLRCVKSIGTPRTRSLALYRTGTA